MKGTLGERAIAILYILWILRSRPLRHRQRQRQPGFPFQLID
ncbi:MAG: hypothetical protein ACFB12_08695 [Leptolyngbyaceae cyanobacterium]